MTWRKFHHVQGTSPHPWSQPAMLQSFQGQSVHIASQLFSTALWAGFSLSVQWSKFLQASIRNNALKLYKSSIKYKADHDSLVTESSERNKVRSATLQILRQLLICMLPSLRHWKSTCSKLISCNDLASSLTVYISTWLKDQRNKPEGLKAVIIQHWLVQWSQRGIACAMQDRHLTLLGKGLRVQGD